MIAAIGAARDAIVAIMALLLASLLRVVWDLQRRVTRLEAMDEYRERILDRERREEVDDDVRD